MHDIVHTNKQFAGSGYAKAKGAKETRTIKGVTCIEDLRQLARRRVPKAFFDYVETGSYAQDTLHSNVIDLQRLKLRQRVLVDVSNRDTATIVAGERLSLPFALGPVALTGLLCGNGEIAACRAAHATGTQYTLSTLSICSIEDVAAAVIKPSPPVAVKRNLGIIPKMPRFPTGLNLPVILKTGRFPLGPRHAKMLSL